MNVAGCWLRCSKKELLSFFLFRLLLACLLAHPRWDMPHPCDDFAGIVPVPRLALVTGKSWEVFLSFFFFGEKNDKIVAVLVMWSFCIE